jgi:putative MFS transporter
VASQSVPLTSYQRRLLVFLSVATFFEGYDVIALSQILPNLRADLGLSKTTGGLLIAGVNAGAIAAWWLVRRADWWGRRVTLSVTIAGYTVFSFATAFAVDAISFGVLQFFARAFLLAEWQISLIYAAEEFPADRRGLVIGAIQAFSALGSVLCAVTAPLLLATPFGWRAVYAVMIVPLVLVIWARRDLRESRRFEQQVLAGGAARERGGFFDVLRSAWRGRVWLLGAIWFLSYCCTQNAMAFWKEFAVGERGWSDGQVGAAVSIAAIVSMPLVFAAGKLLDVIGRKRSALVIYGITAAAVAGAYSFESRTLLTAALTLGVFGVAAIPPLLGAFNTELFPTAMRANAYAWANNGIGRIAYVLSPVFVGLAAESIGWGAAVRATAVFPILALVLIAFGLPETAGRELEETSALAPKR